MSKADFKFQRELMGISYESASYDMGVLPNSVKRWETNSDADMPDDAWEYIFEARENFDSEVDKMVEQARVIRESTGDSELEFPYWANVKHFESCGQHGNFSMRNAITRAAALILSREGFEISMYYPEGK